MRTKNFELDESFITDVPVYKSWSVFGKKTSLTNEQLISVIKGEDRIESMSSDDHPEFKKLRFHLEELGYIEVERSWWNGDRVLKPFRLNGVYFRKGEQFSCGGAMSTHLKFARKRKERSV